ncbi:MAG: HD-GYP domain-containing protein [Solirubrobacterales bacterium]|nr:HD-GYP domain-containing protein [Solirubrobacterales bacterium]
MGRRELAAQAPVAALFVLAVGALLAFGRTEDFGVIDLVLLVVATAVLGRFEFEIGRGYTVPTQLMFVPMLFILPPAVVAPAAAAAIVLERLPAIVAGRLHPHRVLNALGDAWFAIGPATVFELADLGEPSLEDWPFYVLALASQFAGDLGSWALRELSDHDMPRRSVLQEWREAVMVDLLLSPIGLLAAYATVLQPQGYLLVLPLAALLSVFARERRERIDNAIELSAAYRGTALLLGEVLTTDDEYTGVHSQGVVDLALVIADELGVYDEERRLVEFGAMLHDIGKITTPKEIINKAGPLSAEEWVLMRQHTLAGQRLLDRVGGTLHDVGLVVRSSHERYDGRGYPDGLSGEQIPLAARIVAVADAYSAMTTRRSYRDALPHEVAIEELKANAGSQFDPQVAAAAVRVLKSQAGVYVSV